MSHETNSSNFYLNNALGDLGGARGSVLVADDQAYRVAVAERAGDPLSRVEMVAEPEVYSHLRTQPGWHEVSQSGGLQHESDLLNVRLDVSRSGERELLRRRGWVSRQLGVCVMGMPDVYARAQERDEGQLAADMRHWLHNPGLPPLPDHLLAREIDALKACVPRMPEYVAGHPHGPNLLRLAANGMHTVYTLYGHPEIRRANQIVGTLERLEYRVPALFHNGFAMASDVEELDEHYELSGIPVRDRLLGIAAETNSDAVYGGGRRSDNEKGYDERMSAELLAAHASIVGVEPGVGQRLRKIVLGSGFNESTNLQVGIDDEDPLVRAMCGVDLQTLASREGVLDSWLIAIEDGFSARASKARTIGRVLVAHGYRITSLEQALELIDRHANERPIEAPDGPTVKESLAHRLLRSAKFIRSHEYPHDWTGDNRLQRGRHASFLESIANDLLEDPRYSATQAYAESVDYTNSLPE